MIKTRILFPTTFQIKQKKPTPGFQQPNQEWRIAGEMLQRNEGNL